MPEELLNPALTPSTFELNVAFDLGATFFFALTGALAGIRRRYDFIGLLALALVTGLGGSLMRDGLFLQTGPPAVARDGRYLIAVLAGCMAGGVVGNRVERFKKVIAVLDAVGLSVYGVVGAQKALGIGLGIPAAVLIGVINASGGGLLRDIITRQEPLVFKPGQFYVLASLLGCGLFAVFHRQTVVTASAFALIVIGATFLLRMLAIVFNWRTTPVQPWLSDADEPSSRPPPPQGG
jgi:uncharacterized membrane protein YeiH